MALEELLGLIRVKFDGPHQATVLLTNIKDLRQLDGMRSPGVGGGGSRESSSWAEWAPGLVAALDEAIRSGDKEGGEGRQGDRRGGMEEPPGERAYTVSTGLPGLHSGWLRGRSHRRKAHPAWSTLAIDVTGPFKVSKEGRRYLLVGSYVTAVSGGMAKEEDVAAEAGEEIGDEDPFEELAEERGAVRGEEEGEHLALGGQEGVVTRTLMLVEPLKSRRAAEVIAATQSMVARLRWWAFEVTRTGDGSWCQPH